MFVRILIDLLSAKPHLNTLHLCSGPKDVNPVLARLRPLGLPSPPMASLLRRDGGSPPCWQQVAEPRRRGKKHFPVCSVH